MPLVNAKCTNCGGNLKIDSNKDTAICEFCGTVFVVEKAINNFYSTNHNTIRADVVNIYETKESHKHDDLYQAARRAKNINDFDAAKKFYKKILEKDPVSWEAYFFAEYCALPHPAWAPYFQRIRRLVDQIPTALGLIYDNVSDKQDQLNAVSIIIECTLEYIDSYVDTMRRYYNCRDAKNSAGQKGDPELIRRLRDGFSNDCSAISYALSNISQNVQNIFGANSEIAKGVHITVDASMAHLDECKNLYLENEYHSGGCYIATCVYGSYNCPQVWTLRRFRDNTLSATWYGRLFIQVYYKVSPILVEWFGYSKWFKDVGQLLLNIIIAKLQKQGVESGPYQDEI